MSAVEARSAAPRVVFERCPADYLAYAAASGQAWPPREKDAFVTTHAPIVRASMRHLDLLAYLPLSAAGPARRPGEDGRFRQRVDRWLSRMLLDDEYELFVGDQYPRVVALPPPTDRQLAELGRLLGTRHG